MKLIHGTWVPDEKGDFINGGTFSHHMVGAVTAQATLNYMKAHDLVATTAKRGRYLGQQLHEIFGNLKSSGRWRLAGRLSLSPECLRANRSLVGSLN